MNPLVKTELENLQLKFGDKVNLTLNDYAELYGISRQYASVHLRQREIPFIKEGKHLYVSILDLAIHRVKCKTGSPVFGAIPPDEMKRRRGFNQMAERRQFGI